MARNTRNEWRGVEEATVWWMWVLGLVSLLGAVALVENRRGSKGAGQEYDEHGHGYDIRGGGGF